MRSPHDAAATTTSAADAAATAPVGTAPITVVGIGADGWPGLTDPARTAILDADVLVGSPRQLALVEGVPEVTAELRRWPSPLLPGIRGAVDREDDAAAGRRVCVLASGDPMFHGIGATLARLLGPERLRVIPTVSSVTLACARMGWATQDVTVVSLVARPLASLLTHVTDGARLVILAEDATTPGRIAELLDDTGFGGSSLTVLSDLGADSERRAAAIAAEWPPRAAEIGPLNIVAITCHASVQRPPAHRLTRVPGLPDEAYETDGQLTKREVRALTIAALAPAPGELLWDVGAGSGSIAIEWLRTDPACRAVAFEAVPERSARIRRNAEALGVPHLTVAGAAPAGFEGHIPAPDAIFIGGGLTEEGMLDVCLRHLRPGGRLVVNAVTLESEALVLDAHRRLGGSLRRVRVERAGAVGGFSLWRPLAAITQWMLTTPEVDEQ